MLHIVLMCNEQITVGAVAARLVQREQQHWVHMDHQWQLALPRLVATLWTSRKPHILIRIEKEAVTRGLFAKLCHGFLFPTCHYNVVTPFRTFTKVVTSIPSLCHLIKSVALSPVVYPGHPHIVFVMHLISFHRGYTLPGHYSMHQAWSTWPRQQRGDMVNMV